MRPMPLAAVVVVLAVASHAPSAGAQVATPTPMTVDEVNVTPTTVQVKGVPQGGTTAVSATFEGYAHLGETDAQRAAALDRCHRSLLLALSNPGRYVARVSASSCSIALVAP